MQKLYGRYDSLEKWQSSPEYAAWRRSGHVPQDGEPSNAQCNHRAWTFKKHGRICPCGAWIVDFGD